LKKWVQPEKKEDHLNEDGRCPLHITGEKVLRPVNGRKKHLGRLISGEILSTKEVKRLL